MTFMARLNCLAAPDAPRPASDAGGELPPSVRRPTPTIRTIQSDNLVITPALEGLRS